MTPRINNQSQEQDFGRIFSETLLHDIKNRSEEHDLKLRAPIFDLLHPKLIEAKLKFLHNPEQEPSAFHIPGWFIYPLANTNEAPATFLKVYGQPFEIGKILKNNIQEVVIDFSPLGAVLLSRNPQEIAVSQGIHAHLIPVWMNYVLSEELWGNQGKWTRFHERLHALFSKHQLLAGQDYPGFYPLDLKASGLKEFGFEGENVGSTYTLTLPWTFPLTALQHLEKVTAQEF